MTAKKKLEDKLKASLPSLIKKYQSGDSSVKEEIAVLLLPYVRLLVNKYKRTIDDNPDSLAGFIVARIISKCPNIDLTKSIVGYICRSTINYCIDMHRKFVRSLNSKKVSYEEFKPYDTHTNTETEISTLQFILDSNFNKQDASILGMYYLQGKNYKEISTATGQSIEDLQEIISLANEYIF
jgi:DNA-directed RNA polymerase specialized sigma24 family protein